MEQGSNGTKKTDVVKSQFLFHFDLPVSLFSPGGDAYSLALRSPFRDGKYNIRYRKHGLLILFSLKNGGTFFTLPPALNGKV